MKRETKKDIKAWRKVWKEHIKEFGNYQIIEEASQLIGIDSNRIWTQYSAGATEYILNEFSELEIGDSDVINYFVFERPYSEKNQGEEQLTTTIWEDCECEGEEDECEQCEGNGVMPFDVI